MRVRVRVRVRARGEGRVRVRGEGRGRVRVRAKGVNGGLRVGRTCGPSPSGTRSERPPLGPTSCSGGRAGRSQHTPA